MPFSAPDEPAALLETLLAISRSGAALLRPLCAADGTPHDFAWVYLNPAGQRLLQQPPVPAASLRALFPHTRPGGVFDACCQAFLTGEAQHHDAHGGTDGSLRLTAQRSGALVVISFADPHDAAHPPAAQAARRRAHVRQLEQQRAQYDALFMQAPAAVCVLSGPAWVYELVNPRYQQAFPGRALLGRPLLAALPELAGSVIPDLLAGVYATGEPFQATELPVRLARAADGAVEERFWTFTYQARRDAQGQVDGVLVFGYDVTDAVQARQAVEDSRRELQLVTDALPVLIGYLDREERYRFANQAYQAWFHQDPQLLLGRPVREVVGEAAYQRAKGYIDRALAGERVDFEARMPYREAFVKHIRTSYIPDVRAGQVAGFYTLVLDVTDQVEAQQRVQASQHHTADVLAELQHTHAQLVRVNQDLDNFIYTASHDLKAPITNIEGLVAALREELALPAADANTALVLHMMDESVQRFQHTLKHLTDVTHLHHAPTLPVEAVEVRALVADIGLDLQPLLLISQGQIRVAADACPTITFAEKHLRSILYNFISNALKYRHPARVPEVRVQCHTDATGATVLQVHDNGLGLSPAQQQRVFGMFQRQHDHVEGSGIGLYLVKQVVEAAGGRVELDSQPGEGSTFRVVLPAVQVPA